jgi:Rod binding domain-containing protein
MPEPVNRSLTPLNPPGRLNPPRAPGLPADDSRLKAACNDMEALFINHMLSEMRKTVSKSGLTDGGRAEEVYTSLMDAELAKSLAQRGALGLSSMLREQLDRRSTASPGPLAPQK